MGEPAWRAQFGMSASLWSSGGRHAVEDGRWVALSGADNPDLNIILCFGGDLPGVIQQSLTDVAEIGAPSIIMVAAEALGWVQVLADAGWVCVGSTPFMRLGAADAQLGLELGATDPAGRRLVAGDLPGARELLAAANFDPEVDRATFPDSIVDSDSTALWGVDADGSLAAILASSTVGDVTVIWSMATLPRCQRQGYGRRLLGAVLPEVFASGTNTVLLSASTSGEALYRSVGFSVVEFWQQWSRPRWVPGRT
jgi:ribosomal protein S18 acetylase RimI-like enzyme